MARFACIVLVVIGAIAPRAEAQSSSAQPRITRATIKQAVDSASKSMERQVSRADYQQAVQEIVRGRKQRTAGFRLLVLGGFLLPSGLDFVPPKSSLHFNHIVELLGVPIAAIGGYLASVGHKHVREGESVVLRMTLRGLAAW